MGMHFTTYMDGFSLWGVVVVGMHVDWVNLVRHHWITLLLRKLKFHKTKISLFTSENGCFRELLAVTITET